MEKIDNERFLSAFRSEAFDALSSLEHLLIELEKHPQDTEALAAVFRVMHTLKGSSGMFSLDDISSFSHRVETLLSDLREGRVALSQRFMDYTLDARDWLISMIDEGLEEGRALSPEAEAFLQDFESFVSSSKNHGEKRDDAVFDTHNALKQYQIRFTPPPNFFQTGGQVGALLREVLALGTGCVRPDWSEIPTLSQLDPETAYVAWDIELESQCSQEDIQDVFLFVQGKDVLKITEQTVPAVGNHLQEEEGSLGEKRGSMTPLHSSSVRVESAKLDSLMDLVGEMVTIHAQVRQAGWRIGDSSLSGVIERFGRLTEELRDNVMGIRMLPLSLVFSRFLRLVRDASSDLGKKIDLEIHGGETEIDKSILEKLSDPLVHLVRNSVDHGIESPQERLEQGKTESGTVRIEAFQDGASVRIRVEDDGRGLDREAILRKAKEREIIKSDDVLDSESIDRLIFLPGFSTAKEVSDLSGRGVGMDAVRRQIIALGGDVLLKNKPGMGCTVEIIIPLTLAIIEGLLVRIQQEFFVIPLADVELCIEHIDANAKQDASYVQVSEELIPYINLREYFEVDGTRPEIEQMVIVRTSGGKVGLLVDHVVGGNQTVIKSLGRMYEGAEGVSSATILGDGSIAIVLDVERLVDMVEKTEAEQRVT